MAKAQPVQNTDQPAEDPPVQNADQPVTEDPAPPAAAQKTFGPSPVDLNTGAGKAAAGGRGYGSDKADTKPLIADKTNGGWKAPAAPTNP